MCDVCEDPALDAYRERERVPRGEGWRCEYAPEDGEPCGALATWRERFALATDHVCDAHKAGSPAREAEGLGKLLEETGLGDASYIVTIRGWERCEFTDLHAECGRPARWVEVAVLSMFRCDAHRGAE